MAQKVFTMIKLQIPGGQANPAPPVGPALGQHSVNIMEFCKVFNARTQDQNGRIIPVEITVYEDRSFTFITKTPPAAVLIKEALAIEKGSSEPNRNKVGLLTQDQLRQIAEVKMPDLNARDVDQAMLVVAGTARSMGVEVEGLTMDRGEYEAFVLESKRSAAAEAEREAAVAAVRAAARAAAAEVEEGEEEAGEPAEAPEEESAE